MKTLAEKIKERSAMLNCIEAVVDEIRWRKDSAKESIDSLREEQRQFIEEHDGEVNLYTEQRIADHELRIECFNKIEEHLEKLL